MKLLSFKNICLSALFAFGLTNLCSAQDGNIIMYEGNIIVYQDPGIVKLLNLKKEINSEVIDIDRYKINIFSGSSERASRAENSYASSFNSWSSKKVYETPNYKIYVGNFRTRLEADRALIRIKRKFPNAFIFKPKKY